MSRLFTLQFLFGSTTIDCGPILGTYITAYFEGCGVTGVRRAT